MASNTDLTIQDADQSYLERDEYAPTGFGQIALYMKNKRIKTQFQHEEMRRLEGRDNYPQIFAGIKIHINGQTDTPSAQLNSMLILHGAVIYPVLDRKAQIAHNGFIIAATLTPTKRIDFKAYKVVTEYWVLDSIKAGKLLDWRDYAYSAAAEDAVERAASQFIGQMPGGAAVPQKTLADSFKRPPQQKIKPPSPPQRLPAKVADQKSRAVPKTAEDKLRPVTDDVSGYTAYLPSKPGHRAADLLQDEDWRLKHTAVAPDFIEGYYKSSRLHHLSSWKAELPAMVARLIAELINEGKLPSNHRIGEKNSKALSGTVADNRTIFHCDFDCFFSSASLIAHPELRGKPIAVCHAREGSDGSTSEIASCSYEARAFGVKNGISLGRAREMCPDIQTLPYDFSLYERISAIFYKILLSWADNLQAVSCDECYIEVSSKVKAGVKPLDIAEAIRDQVREATSCEVSVGIGHNMVLARLATKRAKPASAFHLTPEQVTEFLAPLDVIDLPGFGYSAFHRLKEQGIETLAQVLAAGRGRLQELLGPQNGIKLHEYSKGIDPRPLEPPGIRSSVSVELNYAIRFVSNQEVQDFMFGLSGELVKRMKALPVTGQRLTLKVMRRAKDADIETPKFLGHGRCDIFTATHDFASPTNDQADVSEIAIRMIAKMQIPPSDLRGIALQMQKLKGNANVLEHANQPKLVFSKIGSTAPKATLLDEPQERVESRKVSAAPQSADLQPAAPQSKRPVTRAKSSIITIEDSAPAISAALVENTKRDQRSKPIPPAQHKTITSAFQPIKKKDAKGKGKEEFQTKIGTQGKVKLDRPLAKLLTVDTVSERELKDHGIDVDFYNSMPRTIKMELLTDAMDKRKISDEQVAQARFVNRAYGISLDDSTSSIVMDNAEQQLLAPLPMDPMFSKTTDIDTIRAKLESWVRGYAKGPLPKDGQKLDVYLMANLQTASATSRGPNLERVTLILEWLHWCIARHALQANRASKSPQISWSDFFDLLLAKINERVVILRGRKLHLNV